MFNKNENSTVRKIEDLIINSEDICICGIVITEILQGIKSDSQYNRVYEILEDLIYLVTTKNTYHIAAKIYRDCRKKVYTIRKTVDCLIAAICIQNSLFILHNDKDFDNISKLFPL